MTIRRASAAPLAAVRDERPARGEGLAAWAAAVVLRSKLAPPRPDPRRIPRPRLAERLDALCELPLTVVAAPPGFGKTTLLAQWHAGRAGGSTAWVSLDREDNDPGRLWAHLAAALGLDEGTGPGGDASEAGHVAAAARALNAVERRGRRTVLVLDDYHHIASPGCHDLVRFLVEHLPDALRLVVGTRRDPPLSLARMRAGGTLGELRARDLRMRPEESRRFLVDTLGLPLSDADVARLHDKADGWPAALYLAAISLRGRDDPRRFVESFAGSNRHVVDYLSSEVLAGQDAAVTDFLLRTSVLDRMCGGLCDTVLETTGSTARLRHLERTNLLVSALDDDLLWFRYHPLLRDMLRVMLAEADPGAEAGLHARASAWFEREGDAHMAVEHALAARDARRAARLVGAHWREAAGRGPERVIDRWLERLPRAVVLADPGLCLARAVLEESLGSPREAVEGWLEAAERHGEAAGGPGDGAPLPLGTDSVLLEAALVRAAAAGHDVGLRLRGARRARTLAQEAGPVARAVAGTHLAHALLLAGRADEAAAAAAEAMAEEGARALPLLGVVQHAVASLAAAALGDEARADEEAATALDRARAHGHEDTPQASIAWLAHGMARSRRGALAQAEEALRRAAALADSPSQSLDRAHALLALAQVQKARSDVGGGARTAAEALRLIRSAADPGMLRRFVIASRPATDGLAEDISEGELRILRLLPTDLTLRQVGERLFVSINTVKSHTRSLYRKLGAGSREEAVARARRLGLVSEPGSPG